MNKILITDIGSTATKALLIDYENDRGKISALSESPTTVEKPCEDVKIGLIQSITKIGKDLMTTSRNDDLILASDLDYLSTSSAGGGLQILVVGLTTTESAETAKKAAYGAGGVILEVLAINDLRSINEQMGLIESLRPDIILFSGGTDNGAIASVLRIAEIIKSAEPKAKFGKDNKIPLIFGGNIKAQELVKTTFKEKYDLHIVPNLRPNLKEENLEPASEKIHELFMNSVMAQAPGYQGLKKIVNDDIIPTPMGVRNTLQHLGRKLNKNLVAIDIGGATTDIFSNLLGVFYRTVSANYGMSYSMTNAMKDSTVKQIMKEMNLIVEEKTVRNYVSNKMLYPDFVPVDLSQKEIEYSVAKQAVKLSKIHHFRMHFLYKARNWYDRIKSNDFMKMDSCFYVEKSIEARKLHISDVDVIIGMGGVFSHIHDKMKVADILDAGFDTKGITEIWRDKHFFSPHLGKLFDYKPGLAEYLVDNECFEKIALIIKPMGKKVKKKRQIMCLYSDDDVKIHRKKIYTEDFYLFFPEKKIEFKIVMSKGYYLEKLGDETLLSTDLPIIIDARGIIKKKTDDEKESQKESISSIIKPENEAFETTRMKFKFFNDEKTLKRELPYAGDILVRPGDKVQMNSILGENKFEPPRLFIIDSLISKLKIDESLFETELKVKEGDDIAIGQKIFKERSSWFGTNYSSYVSPVRGRILSINYKTGTILLRELQDYSLNPVRIDIAGKIGVKPKHIKTYLKKRLNDFVFSGEVIAKNLEGKHKNGNQNGFIVKSPSTGTLTEIDDEKGTVTIWYNKQPHKLFSGVNGVVKSVQDDRSVDIEFSGTFLNGIIGFGKEKYGKLFIIENITELTEECTGKIIFYPEKAVYDDLLKFEQYKISGLIIPSIDNADLVKFLKEEIGIALTGNEDIPFSVIITEGFGLFSCKREVKEILKRADKRDIFIDPHTQIRAGVVRPKIIIT